MSAKINTNEMATKVSFVNQELKAKRKVKLSKALGYAAFVGPALLFFLLVQIIPFFMGVYYSFTSWNGVSSVVEE